MGYFDEAAKALGDEKLLPSNYNEEYIGKLPEFQTVSALFDQMLIRASRVPNKMNPNIWPENEKIKKIFQKFFGVKAFHLYWVPSDVRNAFTFTDSLLCGDRLDDYIIRAQRQHGKGFYDTRHQLSIMVFGYCGILRPELGMNGAELTAIFLHEIGHNFDYSPLMGCTALRRLYMRSAKRQLDKKMKELSAVAPNVATAVKVQGDKGDVDDDGLKTRFSYPEYKDYLLDTMTYDGRFTYDHQEVRNSDRKTDNENLKYILNSKFFNAIYGAMAHIDNLFLTLSGMGILFQLMGVAGRKGEQFADSMSTAYGYGPELISGLEKLGNYKELITKNHFMDKFLRDYCNAGVELFNLYMDEHGSTQARAKDCILKLRNDLKSGDYPEEMKEDLLDELRRLEEEYKAIVNCNPDTKLSLVRGFRKFVDKVFGGRMEIQKFFRRNQM